MLDFILIICGFAGLIVGGNLLVQGAIAIAHRLQVSPMIIGLTLVGFGTSMPELVTSVQAAFIGSPGIAIGNVIGSNIANILLILGAAALLRPVPIAPKALYRDGGVLAAASLLCLGMLLYGDITRTFAIVLLVALIGYIAVTIFSEKRSTTAGIIHYETEISPPEPSAKSRMKDIVTPSGRFRPDHRQRAVAGYRRGIAGAGPGHLGCGDRPDCRCRRYVTA